MPDEQEERMIIKKANLIELFDHAGDGLALWYSLKFYSEPVPSKEENVLLAVKCPRCGLSFKQLCKEETVRT